MSDYECISDDTERAQALVPSLIEGLPDVLNLSMEFNSLSGSPSCRSVCVQSLSHDNTRKNSFFSGHFFLDFRRRIAENYDLSIHSDFHRQGIAKQFTDNVLAFLQENGFHELRFTTIDMGGYYWAKSRPVFRSGQSFPSTRRRVSDTLDLFSAIEMIPESRVAEIQSLADSDFLFAVADIQQDVTRNIFEEGHSKESLSRYFQDRARAFSVPRLWRAAADLDGKVSQLLGAKYKRPISSLSVPLLLLFKENWHGKFVVPPIRDDMLHSFAPVHAA